MNGSANQAKLGLMALCFVLSGASAEKSDVHRLVSLYKTAQAASTPNTAPTGDGALTNQQQAESAVRTLICSEAGGGGGPIRFV